MYFFQVEQGHSKVVLADLGSLLEESELRDAKQASWRRSHSGCQQRYTRVMPWCEGCRVSFPNECSASLMCGRRRLGKGPTCNNVMAGAQLTQSAPCWFPLRCKHTCSHQAIICMDGWALIQAVALRLKHRATKCTPTMVITTEKSTAPGLQHRPQARRRKGKALLTHWPLPRHCFPSNHLQSCAFERPAWERGTSTS